MQLPRTLLLFVATNAVAASAACSPFAEPRTDFKQRATEQLQRHRAIWDSLAVHDYDFNYAKACQCTSETPPVHVQVRNASVQRVTDDAGNDITARAGMHWPTVDSLFVMTQAMIDQEAGTIEIVFDTTYHFPSLAQAFDQRTGSLLQYSAGGLSPLAAPYVPR